MSFKVLEDIDRTRLMNWRERKEAKIEANQASVEGTITLSRWAVAQLQVYYNELEQQSFKIHHMTRWEAKKEFCAWLLGLAKDKESCWNCECFYTGDQYCSEFGITRFDIIDGKDCLAWEKRKA